MTGGRGGKRCPKKQSLFFTSALIAGKGASRQRTVGRELSAILRGSTVGGMALRIIGVLVAGVLVSWMVWDSLMRMSPTIEEEP
jgi:hypothetical protein